MTKITFPNGTIFETDDTALALRVIAPPAPNVALAPNPGDAPKSKKESLRTGHKRTQAAGFKSMYFSDSHKMVREKMLRVAIALRDARREMGRNELFDVVRNEPVFLGTTRGSCYDAACRLCSAGLASSRIVPRRLRLWKATEALEKMSDAEIVDAIRGIGGESGHLAWQRSAPKQDSAAEDSASSQWAPVETCQLRWDPVET